MRKIILTISITLLIASCGGGGGSSAPAAAPITPAGPTPTDPNQLFSLGAPQSTTLGAVYSIQFTGNDSNGLTYSGSITLINRAETMLSGVLVTPQDALLVLTSGGITVTVTGTSFLDSNGNLISFNIQTTGLICTPVSPDNIPTTVRIGDFGILSTLVCNDNTTSERNWRIEDGTNGTILFIETETEKDQFGTIIAVSDITFRIDGNGNIVSFILVIREIASNYTLTIESI